ncbi:hypothetical protein OF83DRAFT_1137551 [Amylostereum chailletii]|nr:hypothetical protein OF83DRAFT_1137551 [Amylostereum chailletii]
MSDFAQHDVLIVGAGPSGLMSAVVLARMGIIPIILDHAYSSDLRDGRGDALQSRSMEIMNSLGRPMQQLENMSNKLRGRSIWDISDSSGPRRTSIGRLYPSYLDLEKDYALVIRQGLMEQVLTHDIERHADGFCIERGWRFVSMDLQVEGGACRTLVVHVDSGEERTITSKYVLACDGGRSAVRRWAAPLGVKFDRISPTTPFCAVDVVGIDSDFPDLEKLSFVIFHSSSICPEGIIRSNKGVLIVVPREPINGKPVARFDMRLDTVDQDITKEEAERKIKELFAPFKVQWDEVYCWSRYNGILQWCMYNGAKLDGRVYTVTQRLINQYSLQDRVFFFGDACHTHSPRGISLAHTICSIAHRRSLAGLGLNTAIHEAHNFGWKLALVVKGIAKPDILSTYASERHDVGRYLVNMDKELIEIYANLEASSKAAFSSSEAKEWTSKLQKLQAANHAYQSGISIRYQPSLLVVEGEGEDTSQLTIGMPGLPVGSRTRPATVTRVCDDVPVSVIPRLDGRFTIYVLPGDLHQLGALGRLDKLDAFLRTSESIFARYGHDIDLHALPIAKRMCFSDTSVGETKDLESVPPGRRLYTFDEEDIPHITGAQSARPHSLFRILVITTTVSTDELVVGDLTRRIYPRAGTKDAGASRVFHPAHFFSDDIPVLSPFRDSQPEMGAMLAHPLYQKWSVPDNVGAIVVARPDGYVGLRTAGFGVESWQKVEDYFSGFLV